MTRLHTLLGSAFVAALVVSPLAGAAQAQPGPGPDRWDWDGGRPDDRRTYELRGAGADMLLPELRETRRGQAFVMRNFDFNDDGRVNRREAQAANDAFLEAVGDNRRGFDWDRRGGGRYIDRDPPRVERPAPGGWDRQGMRDYRFRQGRYGAVFNLQDVLFRTGSAQLRPGAEARLRPLAGYLRANPRVQVRIDGHTDSVGTAAANVALSRARARSVANALAGMGVNPARLSLFGHGEATPVATNGTDAGRRLNRRVEVTLVGQRASSFN